MAEKLNLDLLMALAIDRLESKLEIEFAGQTLSIVEVEALPQKFKLLLARAQGTLQDYYSELLKAQEETSEKLKDETLTHAEIQRLKKEQADSAVNLSIKLLSSSRDLLDANIQYVEAIAQMSPGSFVPLIMSAIAQQEAESGRSLSSAERDTLVVFFVARTSQLIRTALDDVEKEFQKAISKQVRVTLKAPQTIETRLNQLDPEQLELSIPALSSAGNGVIAQHPIFAKP